MSVWMTDEIILLEKKTDYTTDGEILGGTLLSHSGSITNGYAQYPITCPKCVMSWVSPCIK